MLQSPQKTDKQKNKQKRKKIKAFQSFLQKNQPSTPSLQLARSHVSDQEQKLDQLQLTACTICKLQLGDRKKLCGFCNLPACVQHLRKKRKNKQAHKFVRICDKCQDQYLYGKYMKFEVKNQESITAQQAIIQTKYQEIKMQHKGRKTKLLMLNHKQKQILGLKRQNQNRFSNQQNQLKFKIQRLQKKYKQLNQLQNKIKQLENKLPPSFQQDFRVLQIENDKINKELLRLEKECEEEIKARSRRERQIFEEYRQWEQNQRQKMSKKDDQCSMF